MSAPVLLAIVLNLQSVLQLIRRTDGYFNDLKATSVALDPRDLTTVPITEIPYIVVGHRVEPVDRQILGSRPTSVKDTYRITLEARVDAPATDTAAKLTALMNFCADLERTLFDNHGHPQFWGFTRGNNAMETLIQQPKLFLGLPEQRQCFVEQPVDVVFRRDYGVP